MNKIFFPAIVAMPSNRMSGFVKQIPEKCEKHVALVQGIRCREEALALCPVHSKECLRKFLKEFPENSAVRYYIPSDDDDGFDKICSFALNFDTEPQLYTAWSLCLEALSYLQDEEIKQLHFAVFEDEEAKQVHIQAYAMSPDDSWMHVILNFFHNIQQVARDLAVSDFKLRNCRIYKNF